MSHVDQTVAENTSDVLFVHAGVVVWNGKAILIPGRSRAGKSTLVHALVKAGAGYYSDEYAVFDRAGRVYPYARSLSLRTPGRGCGFRLEPLEAIAAARPLNVGLVVMTKYCDAARWMPERVTRGQAALALLANTILARSVPEKALPVFRKAVARTVSLRGPRGEAADAASSILETIDRDAF